MKPHLAAALAVALACAPMAGCQSWLALQPAATAQTRASQALYVAEAAFEGASTALEQATDHGLLKGADAARARQLYDGAHAALLAARLAKAGGDDAGELAHASDAITQAGQIQRLAAPTPASL
jgi:hypothetical protein